MKSRKKNTDVPEELAGLKCVVAVCSQGHRWPWELTFCIALSQRPGPCAADWLVNGWHFSCIYVKILALPSAHLKLFFNMSTCCSYNKKMRWAVSS